MANDKTLLAVTNLSVSIGQTNIVNDVSFDVDRNQCVGIVGESGSGKSTLALSLVGMVGNGNNGAMNGTSNGTIKGTIEFDNRRIDGLKEAEFRQIRGKEIGVILQDPMSSLNPVFTIGNQVAEALACHQADKSAADGGNLHSQVVAALNAVHIPAPEQRMVNYPHQMSGGMRQRIVGAMGIASRPQLLIADEPTTSLDATLQIQYLELLKSLQRQAANSDRPMSILLITHDFGAVAKCCDRVCVMYAGRVVENGTTTEIFQRPAHPYTAALLASRPSLQGKMARLPAIEGVPPRAGEEHAGCAFVARCPQAQEKCHHQQPLLLSVEADHVAACWYPNSGDANE